MAKLPGTLKNIAKARERQAGLQAKYGQRGGKVQIDWNGEKMQKIMAAKLRTRLKVASQLVKDQTKRNISRPVLKYKGVRSDKTQIDPESRSKPGEFPKADTTRLMKDIFNEVLSDTQAVVGTTLDYGLLLETRMDRSFLRRTLQEMLPTVKRILTAKGDM